MDALSAATDLDGDGDPDLLASNSVYLNLLRQTHTPDIARVGQTYTVEVYARFGRSRIADMALPYLSPGAASLLTPFGKIGLDSRGAIALPPLVIPQPAGVGSASFMIPNDPNLMGLSVYAQALVAPFPGTPHVTNVTFDIVR